jgi:hypothetical protein
MTDIETVLLAVNQTLEISIHMSARLEALESLLIEKGVFTDSELRARIAKLKTESKDLSNALQSLEPGRAAS